MAHVWNRWWRYAPYGQVETEEIEENRLIKFRQPETGEEVLNVKHWYFPNLEELRPNREVRQGAKV